jgi:hypothetical protein
MKITNLHLIEESDEYYIFSVSFKTFFGEKTKTAVKSKNEWASYSYWADSGKIIWNDKVIDAWLTTDKKDLTV